MKTSPETKTVTISVTQEDIEHGRKGMCNHCPVAKAINRAISPIFYARVFTEDFVIKRESDGGSVDMNGWPLPEIAQGFITAFDQGENVSPFGFPIELPVSVLR